MACWTGSRQTLARASRVPACGLCVRDLLPALGCSNPRHRVRSACYSPPPPRGRLGRGSSTSLGLAGVLIEVVAHPLDLARLVDARPRQARLLPRELHAVERLEVVVPHRLRVVLGEEDLADPLLIAALQEAQDERGLAHDLLHAHHLDFAGRARHGRPARGAAQSRGGADRVGVQLLRAHEGHVEEGLRARVARDEHVVGHDAQAHLLAPLVGPHLRVVVDAAHHGRLRADDDARLLLQPLDGRAHLLGL
mmetsp:Transcript_17871/g.44666  ORF Transcript_17871/g.44666 Transcript_17871/m.44666 type:complete len:251 (+) Transcript_17871:189-941(+)